MEASSDIIDFVPILISFIVALGFVAGTILISNYLGPKRKNKRKLDVFECGIESVGDARGPFSVRFFLVAILFVLFDVEVIFMYPWAVNFKHLGMIGFVEMMTYTAFLLIGFFYVIKKGALDWAK